MAGARTLIGRAKEDLQFTNFWGGLEEPGAFSITISNCVFSLTLIPVRIDDEEASSVELAASYDDPAT